MYAAAMSISPWALLFGISTSMARFIKIGPSKVRRVEKRSRNEAMIIVLEYLRKYGRSFFSTRQFLLRPPVSSIEYLSSQCQCMVHIMRMRMLKSIPLCDITYHVSWIMNLFVLIDFAIWFRIISHEIP